MMALQVFLKATLLRLGSRCTLIKLQDMVVVLSLSLAMSKQSKCRVTHSTLPFKIKVTSMLAAVLQLRVEMPVTTPPERCQPAGAGCLLLLLVRPSPGPSPPELQAAPLSFATSVGVSVWLSHGPTHPLVTLNTTRYPERPDVPLASSLCLPSPSRRRVRIGAGRLADPPRSSAPRAAADWRRRCVALAMWLARWGLRRAHASRRRGSARRRGLLVVGSARRPLVTRATLPPHRDRGAQASSRCCRRGAGTASGGLTSRRTRRG